MRAGCGAGPRAHVAEDRGVDRDAFASATFVGRQLPKGSTTEQAWKFLGLAYPAYCPAHQALLQMAAEKPA